MKKIISILEEVCETNEIADNMDVDLFDAGLLDSLTTIELLLKIEEVFGLSLMPSDITRDDVGSANRLIEFLSCKGIHE